MGLDASRSAALPTSPGASKAGEAELPKGARAAAGILADAHPTEQNRFKVDLVERTLGAVIAEARG
jgi:xanthine dehydrogenase YagS FAD-binding subunit